MSASERPSAARARLSRGLDAFDGAVDGGAVDLITARSLGLRIAVDEHGISSEGAEGVFSNARYLDGAGELGGGHWRNPSGVVMETKDDAPDLWWNKMFWRAWEERTTQGYQAWKELVSSEISRNQLHTALCEAEALEGKFYRDKAGNKLGMGLKVFP